MAPTDPITFVTAANDPAVLNNNFLVSPCLVYPTPHQVLVQRGYRSAAKAYNEAIEQSSNDLIVFAHQDVIFPSQWADELKQSLDWLERTDPGWGVLGCFGETQDHKARGYIYWPGRGAFGAPLAHPERIQTLDEIVLIIRKSSGLRFDESLPHFHFYGTSICLEAARRNMNSYAIPALCIHNAQSKERLPPEFYECYRYIKKKWKKYLPIQTTCIRITKFDMEMRRRRLREFLLGTRQRKGSSSRVADGQSLLAEVNNVMNQAKFSVRKTERPA